MPALTIVIPCYNTHRHLPETLESLRAQTFQDFEIIIVNDGSTNKETLSFLSALPADIRVLNQENKGLPAARNAGFSMATTEYILPLDSDDCLAPHSLERLMQAIQNSPQADFAHCYLRMMGEGEGELHHHYNLFEQLCFNKIPYCILIRKQAWQRVGGYDETMRSGYEDWEFNLRLGLNGLTAVCVPEPLFYYRVSNAGMLRATSLQRHAAIWESIRRRHSGAYHWPNLWKIYGQWRNSPSARPLFLCWGWLFLAKILTASALQGIFRVILPFSSSRLQGGKNEGTHANK